jgi:hypothetical protein
MTLELLRETGPINNNHSQGGSNPFATSLQMPSFLLSIYLCFFLSCETLDALIQVILNRLLQMVVTLCCAGYPALLCPVLPCRAVPCRDLRCLVLFSQFGRTHCDYTNTEWVLFISCTAESNQRSFNQRQ